MRGIPKNALRFLGPRLAPTDPDTICSGGFKPAPTLVAASEWVGWRQRKSPGLVQSGDRGLSLSHRAWGAQR
jgi:hypothetical protein